ncbi:tRNA pseudouridine(55) synthase TruB [Christensenellaceae bacterium OttesenSCG-928-L17]|nr:tRNA pseudouridine(55) synthase TruB [Christensenellaceae bacterium OttesenSCG-928-L17]
MNEYEGIVNILKPPGMTSSNVVSDVRRLFGVKRVGHTGTLDPGAAGVLPVCVGRATRLFDIFVDKQKEYIAEIAFGACTDTQDSYGQILKTSDINIDEDALRAVLPAFTGRQVQIAPAYSALKIEGQALYKLARAGKEVPERKREVEISALELLQKTAQNRYLLKVNCSRGTYVRTLCEDIGRALLACAHMSFLLRSASGDFCVAQSYTIRELEQMQAAGTLWDALLPIENALHFLSRVEVAGDVAEKLKHGSPVSLQGDDPKGEGLCRIYCGETFLGVGDCTKAALKLKLHLYQ